MLLGFGEKWILLWTDYNHDGCVANYGVESIWYNYLRWLVMDLDNGDGIGRVRLMCKIGFGCENGQFLTLDLFTMLILLLLGLVICGMYV